MVRSVIASLGLFATSVSALGSAVVVNQCPYDVYVADVPAIGGGLSQQDQTLSSGAKWSQQWTQLDNGAGWSIKLSKDSNSLSNIMQYEYTYHTVTPDIIWYDLSDVNGNPWDGDWEVSAVGTSCDPKDQAYRFSTDDAYGMQSCSSDSEITVTLCSGSGSSSGSGSGSGSSSAPSPSSSESPVAPAAPATTVAVSAYSTPAAKAQATEAPASTIEAPAPTEEPATSTTVEVAAAPTSTTEAASTTAAASPTAAAPAWTGPWTDWILGADGAVIADNIKPKLVKHDVAAPSLTTFATSVVAPAPTAADAAVVEEGMPSIAGRIGRRHEHAARRHQHHHNA